MVTKPVVFNHVYFVDSADFNPVAIRPMIQKNHIFWEDTTMREVALEIKDYHVKGKELVSIQTTNCETIAFKLLDKETYDNFVIHQVAGQPTFRSTKDLQKYYLETNFYAYY